MPALTIGLRHAVRQLQTALADLAVAAQLLQGEAPSVARDEARVQIYLAREAIETALRWGDESQQEERDT